MHPEVLPVLLVAILAASNLVPSATALDTNFGPPLDRTLYLHGAVQGTGLLLRPWAPGSTWNLPGALSPPGCGREPTWRAYVGADSPPGEGRASLSNLDHVAAPASDYWSADSMTLTLQIERNGFVAAGILRIEAELETGRMQPTGDTDWLRQFTGAADIPQNGAVVVHMTNRGDLVMGGIQRLSIYVHDETPCIGPYPLGAGTPMTLSIHPESPATLQFREAGTVTLRTMARGPQVQLNLQSVWGPSLIDWNYTVVQLTSSAGILRGYRVPEFSEHNNPFPWFDGVTNFAFATSETEFENLTAATGNATLSIRIADRINQTVSVLNVEYPLAGSATCVRDACYAQPGAAAANALPNPQIWSVTAALALAAITWRAKKR